MLRSPRIVMIHGAATTASVWGVVAGSLEGLGDLKTPQRRYSGDWESEVTDLVEMCTNAFVIGVSGGATLGLELVMRAVPLAGAVLHEPAAGSLAPHLLDSVSAAYTARGVDGFGAELYGPAWTREHAPDEEDAVRRDFAMFRAFEPRTPAQGAISPLLTVGELSSTDRHESVAALGELLGARVAEVAGAGHAVHLENQEEFVRVVREELSRVG